MKSKKKLGIIIVFAIVVAAVVGVIIYSVGKSGSNDVDFSGDNGQANVQDDVEVTHVSIEGVKKVGDIEFSDINIDLIARNKCEFTAMVTNTTDKYIESTRVRIKVIDKSGKVDEIFGGVISDLAGYEPNEFKTIALANIMDVVDVQIEAIVE